MSSRIGRDRPPRWALLVLVPLGLLPIGCNRPQGEPAHRPADGKPNIVLISIDTLRADRLGSYGFPAETSPALDALAEQGVRFEQAISQSSWTLPAHVSLFTSQYVDTHRVTDERTALAEDSVTLAEALSGAGYQTAGFASWVFLSPKFGFSRGFDEYYLQIDPTRLSLSGGDGADNARQVVDAVIDWLIRADSGPHFLFVHLFDPHLDYRPPAPYDRMFTDDYKGPVDGSYDQIQPQILGMNPDPPPIDAADRRHLDNLYQGEIRFVDDQIGRLLEAVADRWPADELMLIVIGDHGEEIGDHGSLEGHGWTLFEEIVRVPWLIRFPHRAHRGTVVRSPVALIDLAPTLLEFLQIEAPRSFQGRNLLPLIVQAAPARVATPVLSDSGGRFAIFKRSARGSRFKLIETKDTGLSQWGLPIESGFELYDLELDPGERDNLFTPDHPALPELLAALAAADSRERLSARKSRAVEPDLSDEELQMLKRLGYVQ